MPIIYPTKIRRRMSNIDLDLLKQAILDEGFEFVRDGGFRPEDEPFKFSNYLFYHNPKTGMGIRVGYDYPIFGKYDRVFEIMYAKKEDQWHTDITPDCRQPKWRKIMRDYNNK